MKYKCKYCDNRTNNSKRYTHDLGPDTFDHVCDECEDRFTSAAWDSYEEHLRTYSGYGDDK